ncbi:uncharacterized protein TRIADDRAFT_55296 [Trichoplax adhaerens]|uniref:Cysteine-rich DPF motif domain-containing protein 1 n=1 Tax=Trichoplax adhaerens TaxID=10228 RepID=B3RUH9_TRIAD|nr:hypothetical protein TRIADDRAFT_55296 [Trichoplax adhaerens]EDV25336.1 hypothetical protein TRIADDRAFT_55296 [Trichoplax adhaerens]|eukprot:XP_002111369.1 hypothetical protein TRIADDRAFT_55296 [Trichoplax adhaerens]
MSPLKKKRWKIAHFATTSISTVGAAVSIFRLVFLYSNSQQTSRCNVCKLQLAYEYFGQRPPFGKKTIALLENAYVIHDPFDADGSHLILGSHCSECGAAVCVDQKCSLFYVKRFCCQCCIARNEDFPTEVQKEIKKMKELNSKN